MRKLIPFILLLAVFACQREAAVETEVLIPLHLEGMPVGTRTDIADGNGACTWTVGDIIGLYVVGESYSKYKTAVVIDGNVRLSLAADQERTDFAVYPSAITVPEHHTASDFRLAYPVEYYCGLLSQSDMDTFSPAPMVADNTADELYFRHVGGLLRVRVTHIPSGTTSLAVRLLGIDHITGTYRVSDPGTLQSAATLVEGTGNTVTFKSLPAISDGTLTLNVPLPPGDYTTLTGVQVTAASASTSRTMTNPVGGWGTISRTQGKICSVDFSEAFITPNMGTFRTYHVSPGMLVWDETLNSGAGGYTLTDGADPFEILRYYNASATTSPTLSEVLGHYYHSWYSLKTRLDGASAASDIQHPFIPYDHYSWKIPSSSDWMTILDGNESLAASSISVNNVSSVTNANNYAMVKVSVAGTGYVVDRYLGGPDYMNGMLLFPDGASIICPSITATRASGGNVLTFNAFSTLIEGGCVFLPISSYYSINWGNNGSYGAFYWASDYGKYLCFYMGSAPTYGGTQSLSYAQIVRLVRE